MTWKQVTNMEQLATEDHAAEGAVLKYNYRVLAVGLDRYGYRAAIYEFVETPEETGLAETECRLNLTAVAPEIFDDGGHAIAWCIEHL